MSSYIASLWLFDVTCVYSTQSLQDSIKYYIFLCLELGELLDTTRGFMIIGLLLYGLAFVLLAMAQFLNKDIFQKLILPVFFSIRKWITSLIFSVVPTVTVYKSIFSLLYLGQVKKTANIQRFLISNKVVFKNNVEWKTVSNLLVILRKLPNLLNANINI